jgi:hypothetical protein
MTTHAPNCTDPDNSHRGVCRTDRSWCTSCRFTALEPGDFHFHMCAGVGQNGTAACSCTVLGCHVPRRPQSPAGVDEPGGSVAPAGEFCVEVIGGAGWVDRHGDVWHDGDDGLMHTFETAPFPRDHVERKWGPLRPVEDIVRDRRTT